ncbi:riboflavin synthase [Chloroflexota bacterium]
MFTGIVEEVGTVARVQNGKITVNASGVLEGLDMGGSISVSGVCLTATSIGARYFSADVMGETLQRTNLGLLSAGEKVNLEKPVVLSGPLGGHLVQGHVDATGRIASIRRQGEEIIIVIEAPPAVMRYIVEKGFIAVDGVSLTVVNRDSGSFEVSIVEYTRQHTNLDNRKVGDLINLEADIIAKYVEQFTQAGKTGITTDFLQEHGFLVG